MKFLFLLIILFFGKQCLVNQNNKTNSSDENYAAYYIVIADTSLDYAFLESKMQLISKKLNLSIDTMDRYYNKAKDLIALPDDYDDEIYAGDYYPRRYPSESLSLEYFDFYEPKTTEKTIVLVAGIYEERKSADSLLVVLKQVEKKAFKIRAKVYIGCMH